MPNEEKMTLNERRKYLRLIRTRYLKGNKLERGRLLDEMEAVTGLFPRSLIRLMSGSLERRVRRKQRDGLTALKLKTRCGSSRLPAAVPGQT